MRQHRTLQVGQYPIQQIHSFGFCVVVARDLLLQQADQEGLQIKILGQQTEFFQHQLGAAEALHVLVLGHVLFEIADHLIPACKAALDFVFDRERGILAGKVENRVHVAEELLGLLRSDLVFGLAGGLFVGLLSSFPVGLRFGFLRRILLRRSRGNRLFSEAQARQQKNNNQRGVCAKPPRSEESRHPLNILGIG